MKDPTGIMGTLVIKNNDTLIKVIVKEELDDSKFTNDELVEIILSAFKRGKEVGHSELKSVIATL